MSILYRSYMSINGDYVCMTEKNYCFSLHIEHTEMLSFNTHCSWKGMLGALSLEE